MELLLDHGADVSTLSGEGKTALDFAIEMDSEPVTDFLRERGGQRADDMRTAREEPMDNKLTRAFEAREGRKLTDREQQLLNATGHDGDSDLRVLPAM